MKNILFILLCVFTTQLFSQTTQNTISEEKFGLLSCKNFSKTYIEEDMTYNYVYCSFQNMEYQHITDIGSIMYSKQSDIDEVIEQLEMCLEYMDNKKDSFSVGIFSIYDFHKNVYITEEDGKFTSINKKKVLSLIEWLKSVDMGE